MKTLSAHLSQYAMYHRDPRNIATHLVGVPLITLSVFVLLSRPLHVWHGLALTNACPVALAVLIFYLRLDLRYALVMALLFGIGLQLGCWAADLPLSLWLAVGLGGFVLGWVIQIIGHVYEGRKPAFLDDLSGLLIGPLFVLAEIGFRLGLRLPLRADIERSMEGLQDVRAVRPLNLANDRN